MSHQGFTVERDREILVEKIGIPEAARWPERGENRAYCPLCKHEKSKNKNFTFNFKPDSGLGGAWKCHRCQNEGGILGLIQVALGVSEDESKRIYWPSGQGRKVSKRSLSQAQQAAPRVIVPEWPQGPGNTPSKAEERGYRPRPDVVEFLYREVPDGPLCLKKKITRSGIGKDGKPDKSIEWLHQAGDGRWVSGLGGRKAFLYRWTGIQEGLQSGTLQNHGIIFLAEGEQKADLILDAGLPATFIPGSVTGEILEAAAACGLEWAILPDADPIDPNTGKKPGKEKAETWAKALLGQGIRTSVLQGPGLDQEKKHDVQDWAWGHGWTDPEPEGKGTVLTRPDEMRAALVAELGNREACLMELVTPAAASRDGDGGQTTKRGRATLSTTAQAIRDLTAEVGVIFMETFTNKLHVIPGPVLEGQQARPWTDHDLLQVQEFLQLHGGLSTVSERTTEAAVMLVAGERKRDVLADYLQGLTWDGVPRIRTWLEQAYGVTLDPYLEAAGKVWILGMVARALSPGCKMDDMPILEGPQGIKKSQSIRELTGAAWFADLEYVPNDKDFILQIQGRWAVEISELQGFNKAEANGIKGFLSRQTDPIRKPYGRIVEDLGRRCVLVGTTNNHEYLRDPTGGRRFWPIPVQLVDLDWIRANRDQLFAEGVALYKAGEPWWVEDESVRAKAREIQESRTQEDSWASVVQEWLEQQYGSAVITTAMILSEALDIPKDRQSQREQIRVSNVMTGLGWAKKQETVGGKRDRYWRRF